MSALSALPVPLKAGEISFFANQKSHFISVISGYIVKYINSFYNIINKQFHMFMSICLQVKLIGRIMPKFVFNLKVLNASSFPKYDLIVFCRFVYKRLTLLNFYIC